MATYIVTYDLNREARRPPLLKEIKDSYAYAFLSESSYAISTNETVDQVYDRLRPFIDDNDALYIITLKRPYVGFGQQDVNDWLENQLTW